MRKFKLSNYVFATTLMMIGLISCKEVGIDKTFPNGSLIVEFPDTTIDFNSNNTLAMHYSDFYGSSQINIYGEQFDSTNVNKFAIQVVVYEIFKSGYEYPIDMLDYENQHTYGLVEKMTDGGSYTLQDGNIAFDMVNENQIKGTLTGNFSHLSVDYPLICHFDFTP